MGGAQRPGSLRSGGPAGGGRHPARSVREITTPVRPPLCPWSLHSAEFPRGPASGRIPARHHAAGAGTTRQSSPAKPSAATCRADRTAASGGIQLRQPP
jgi:hypothetical protein